MIEVSETLKNWKQEILNSFVWIKDRRISNGPIEGKNVSVKRKSTNKISYIHLKCKYNYKRRYLLYAI